MEMNYRAQRLRGAVAPLAILLLALAQLALAGAALAQTATPGPTTLTVSGPRATALGEPVRIVAVLRDGRGSPVPEARILFTSPASFGGTTGEMPLGEVWTDAKGVALLEYRLRIQGDNQFVARFLGDGGHRPAEASTVVLATGDEQLSQRSAGVRLPVLGAWTIILVIGSVWSVYFLGMLMVAGIPEPRGSQPWSERGGHL